MTRVRKTLAKGVSFMRPPDEVAFPAALTYGRRAGVFWLVLERVRQLYWSSVRGEFGQTGSVLGQAARAAALSEVRLRQRLHPLPAGRGAGGLGGDAQPAHRRGSPRRRGALAAPCARLRGTAEADLEQEVARHVRRARPERARPEDRPARCEGEEPRHRHHRREEEDRRSRLVEPLLRQ